MNAIAKKWLGVRLLPPFLQTISITARAWDWCEACGTFAELYTRTRKEEKTPVVPPPCAVRPAPAAAQTHAAAKAEQKDIHTELPLRRLMGGLHTLHLLTEPLLKREKEKKMGRKKIIINTQAIQLLLLLFQFWPHFPPAASFISPMQIKREREGDDNVNWFGQRLPGLSIKFEKLCCCALLSWIRQLVKCVKRGKKKWLCTCCSRWRMFSQSKAVTKPCPFSRCSSKAVSFVFFIGAAVVFTSYVKRKVAGNGGEFDAVNL